uniref:Ubiquitin-like domain-containing protein n=1 Tax=Chromera velia CCMP2878 TaxID=1169474 RepID=A0A0G4FEY1_9ALVE|eukprot:Cvel_16584.t1-p1 / transcript=Cvel_16584.t1 / gene=Cvel_16584 / organism=Chromera_velia_CCMP2878 / gene_product=hypothetical protein / transcript_product=hypothetical protein / location=Cvel_scaffold1284:3264-5024(+) / protein_length=587 / sequence_SO=supercontig / SO=protein_coding / is_pseudo=false
MRLRVRVLAKNDSFVEIEATDTVRRLREKTHASRGQPVDPCTILFYSQPGRGVKYLKDEWRRLEYYGVSEDGMIDLSLSFEALGGGVEVKDNLCSLVRAFARSENEVPLHLIKHILLTYKEAGLSLFLTDVAAPSVVYLPSTPSITSALHEALRVFLGPTKEREAVLRKRLEVLREILFSGLCKNILDQKDSCGRTPISIAREVLRLRRVGVVGESVREGTPGLEEARAPQNMQSEPETDPFRLVSQGRVMLRPQSKHQPAKAGRETSPNPCGCYASWHFPPPKFAAPSPNKWDLEFVRPKLGHVREVCSLHREPYREIAQRDRDRERQVHLSQFRESNARFIMRAQTHPPLVDPTSSSSSSSATAAAAEAAEAPVSAHFHLHGPSATGQSPIPLFFTPWTDARRDDESVDQSDFEEVEEDDADADTVSLPDSSAPAPKASVSAVRQLLQEPLRLLLLAFRARDTVCLLRQLAVLVREQRGEFDSRSGLSNSPIGLFLNLDPAVRLLHAGASRHAKERNEGVDGMIDPESSTVGGLASSSSSSSSSSSDSVDCQQSGRDVGESEEKRISRLDGKLVHLQQRVLSFLW